MNFSEINSSIFMKKFLHVSGADISNLVQIHSHKSGSSEFKWGFIRGVLDLDGGIATP